MRLATCFFFMFVVDVAHLKNMELVNINSLHTGENKQSKYERLRLIAPRRL